MQSQSKQNSSDSAKNEQTWRFDRRAFLAGISALSVAGMGSSALAAPIAGGKPNVSSLQDGPNGQIILARTMSELTTLHPHLERFTSALAISYHVNEGLTKFSPTFELVPGLASDWTVSDDALVFTFNLREGITWHDGEPFTSADVAFTIELAGSEESQSPASGTVQTFISSVETPDDNTVVITLTEPYSPLLTVLAEQLTILPAHLLRDDVFSESFGAVPVGTGPYKVTERETSFITLEANENYWGDAPFTQTIILRDSPEAAAQQAGLLAGELDVIPYNPATMAGLEAQGYAIYTGLAGSVHGINIDLMTPLLQDPAVRQALQLSLDRERIVSILYSGGQLANTCVSPAYGPYHNDQLATVTRDVEAAKQVLEEAGWVLNGDVREKDGQQLKLRYQAWAAQHWQDLAAIAQASWLEAGIDVEIVTVELANLADTMSGRYELATVGWPLTSDAIVGLTQLFQTTDKTLADGGTRNVFHYSSEVVDGLLDEAYATTDAAARAELAHQIQVEVYNDLPLIPFAHPAYQMIAQPNITLDETGGGALSSVGPGFFMNRWAVTEG